MAKTKKQKPLSTAPDSGKSISSKGNRQHHSQIWSDERFVHLVNDPRFKGIPRTEKKVKIDKRFQSMFDDERFNVKHTVDKYGRKVKQSSSDELRKYYELETSDGEINDDDKQGSGKDKDNSDSKEDTGESDDGQSGTDSEAPELDDEEKALGMSDKIKSRLEDLEIDYARGEGAIASDSSSSDDDSEDDELADDEVFIDHVWGELDADAERTDESTRRLALCNVDWDRIRAVDIMVMLNSFLPRGSIILKVTIYPSEFGKERMKEEEERGPQELTGGRNADSDESEASEDEDETKQRQIELLREYQLNRLKYYYAVVECDSVETADKLYKECDGVEYESTANKIDLRFIPDEMEFEDEPKESCSELPEIGKYEPRIFTTTALNQAKVELTWDENDVERKEFNEKIRAGKINEVSNLDLQKYVACSSSEDDDEAENQSENDQVEEEMVNGKLKKSKKQDMISRYKALLGDLQEQEEIAKNEKVEMEFTWKVDDDGNDKNDSENESDSKAVKQNSDGVNPFEKLLEKAKEKKKRRKELKKKKKRGELNSDGEVKEESSDEDLPYGVDLNDPFFATAFDEKEFDLKKSNKKDKKRNVLEQDVENEAEIARKRAELELIIDETEDDKSHFNLKSIQEQQIDLKSVSKSKRKRILKKSKKQIEQRQRSSTVDDFALNLDDDRFKAVYEKAEYNIDPTNPLYKKTNAMEMLIQEKLKKRPLKDNDVPTADDVKEIKKVKKDISTSLLVKSIKRKIGK
ncbi:ESF1 homolog [Malaya genurostris]|uniref:ESF1 homolog n=1 Tax=Malaya genurostris TaxID=325434 RepID=UPI0026F3D12A|nr:ESF1 homolog [Malaya genurostris]